MPPSVNVPCLLHFLVSHLLQENLCGASAERAALSFPNRSSCGVPFFQWGLPYERLRLCSRSLLLKASMSPTAGMGTNMFRQWVPTLFSTLPFSLPK